MAEFFVDVARGDDRNAGSAASPVRSIAQAILLSAGSSDATGTIHVAAGTYEPPNENFPLMMQPGYALLGAGKDRTLIRFTGEATPLIPPTAERTHYWGGTALYAGTAVRDLTLRANPVPSEEEYSCAGMLGITALNDGTVIENVDILSPQFPEEFPGERLPPEVMVEPGFLVAVDIRGADVTYRNSRVTLSRVGATRGGSSLLDAIRLEGTQLYVESDARVQNCDSVWSPLVRGIYDPPACPVYGGSPTIGPGNHFNCSSGALIDCRRGATPIIDGNTLAAYGNGIVIRDGAWARVTGNFIGLQFGQRLVDVQASAAHNSVFEDNTFYGGGSPWDAVYVHAPTDFGGGPGGSRGGNHFGPVTYSGNPERWLGLLFDIPGRGAVYAANNFWRDGRPENQIVLGATTSAFTRPAMVDPITRDDGLELFRAAFR